MTTEEILQSYAPYNGYPEFREAMAAYACHSFNNNPYPAESIAGEAWVRGVEAAMRIGLGSRP
jgi:hypothetical protein